QFLAEDVQDHYNPVVEWSERTIAVPPGGPGTGCGEKDGWVAIGNAASYRYRNHTNAMPPGCAPGSANGLTEVRLHRHPNHDRIIDVKVRAKNTTPYQPALINGGTGKIRMSATVESTIGPTNVDRCAHTFVPVNCAPNGSGTTLKCKTD